MLAEIGIVGVGILLFLLYRASRSRLFETNAPGYKYWFVDLLPLIPAMVFDHYVWSLYAGFVLIGIATIAAAQRGRQQSGVEF